MFNYRNIIIICVNRKCWFNSPERDTDGCGGKEGRRVLIFAILSLLPGGKGISQGWEYEEVTSSGDQGPPVLL